MRHVLLALWLGALFVTPVRAQEPLSPDGTPVPAQIAPDAAAQAEPEGYRAAIDQALAEYRVGNWEEARALFARAHALYPNARTLRGLGMVEYERRNYVACVRHLEAALAHPIKALEGELRAETEQLLARANLFVARVRLEVSPDPATVFLDGAPVARSADGLLLLQAGEHTLSFEAPKQRTEKRVLSVKGGESISIQVELQRDVLVAPPPRRDPLYKSPWLWTVVGVVVAGAVTGAVIALRPEPATTYEKGSPELGNGLVQTLVRP